MKKLTIAVLSLLLVMLSVLPVFADETVPLAADVPIVIGENASDTDRSAARSLQTYLLQSTGVTHEIVPDNAEKATFELAVGATNRLALDWTGKADGSYRIQRYDGGISIAGAGQRGTIYGVYAFLEKYAGCRWYTADLYVIPPQEAVRLPAEINDVYDVFFEYTDTDWVSPRDIEYSLANGLNGGPYREIPAEKGGTVDYISNFCHTLTTQFCSPDLYFEEHPEYFALFDGKREGTQLCLTNEDVYEIVLDEVLELLDVKHDPTAAVQIVSLTQHDNQHYCKCDNCRALDEENGSQSGTMITFVNRIANAVKEAGYDNIAIDTFAYQYTRKAPSKVVPQDNVIVRLCTIECCFSHPLEDAGCERNVALMADLAAWNEICDRIYVWDYTTNYTHTLGLFPNFGVLQQNMQTFYEHGVKGVYEEGNYYMARCDTEFGELRSYLLSKLLQNPYCDYNAEMNAFLEAYYGAGWENIRDFLDLTTDNAAENHLYIYQAISETLTISADTAAYCDTLWENALDACEDETQLQNLERSKLSWRFWKACHRMGEFKSLFDSMREKEKLFQQMQQSGVTQYSEGRSTFDFVPSYRIFNPDNWCQKNNNTLLTYMFNGIAAALYAVTLAASAVLFVRGIRRKKRLYCVHLPLLAAALELILWNRRAFLAWRDIDQFVLTLVIYSLAYAFLFYALRCAAPEKPTRKQGVLHALLGVGVFLALYEGSVLIVNNAIYHGTRNVLAYSIAMLLCSIAAVVAVLLTCVRLRKNK